MAEGTPLTIEAILNSAGEGQAEIRRIIQEAVLQYLLSQRVITAELVSNAVAENNISGLSALNLVLVEMMRGLSPAQIALKYPDLLQTQLNGRTEMLDKVKGVDGFLPIITAIAAGPAGELKSEVIPTLAALFGLTPITNEIAASLDPTEVVEVPPGPPESASASAEIRDEVGQPEPSPEEVHEGAQPPVEDPAPLAPDENNDRPPEPPTATGEKKTINQEEISEMVQEFIAKLAKAKTRHGVEVVLMGEVMGQFKGGESNQYAIFTRYMNMFSVDKFGVRDLVDEDQSQFSGKGPKKFISAENAALVLIQSTENQQTVFWDIWDVKNNPTT